MSWGGHPDTLTMACAQGWADRSGHAIGTLEYEKAYRQAYERAAGPCAGWEAESLAEYLARMDAFIAEQEAAEGAKE